MRRLDVAPVVEKTAEGVGRLLPFIARVVDVALFFGFLPWLF